MTNEPHCRADSEKIVRKYADTVYRLAFSQMRNSYDAEDVFQEVFLRYFRKKPQFKNDEHEKAWFLRVTINCAKKYWASAWVRRTEPVSEELPFENMREFELFDAVGTLPQKYRVVIHLYYFEGYSTAEIAAITGQREPTVRSQLARARAKLRDTIGGEKNAE